MPERPPFEKILIANRGEIARRVALTCRELGVGTVAVYAEPDCHAPFVDEVDEAVALGGSSAATTYLDGHKLIQIAQQTGAKAIHPGYGFLSENADFAQAVIEAGLTWVGPHPETIRTLGSKAEARVLARRAGLPLIPGRAEAPDGDDDALLALATKIGFPVLIKASAGGGGKGMRVVHDADAFLDAVAAARREARAAFGQGRLVLEKLIENARHVEVQVLGDEQGHVIHLFERECSVQRRLQKMVEESPSTALDERLRRALTEAAVTLAKEAGYVNAGTVEFLLDGAGQFYFLEVNTRLQVEHGVSEWVTGLDLVAWQLRLAAGQALDLTQEQLTQRGHAIEVRLYAEDPEHDFAPQTGTLEVVRLPHAPGVRWDSGVERGSRVSAHYDSLLAKLIVYGHDRPAALRRLRVALRGTVLLGVTTNVAFLQTLVEHPAFERGETTTQFVEAHFSRWQAPPPGASTWLALAAFELWGKQRATATAGAVSNDPWELDGRWRNA